MRFNREKGGLVFKSAKENSTLLHEMFATRYFREFRDLKKNGEI